MRDTTSMLDERGFLRRVASAGPDELMDLVLQAGADEQRVLRIYLGAGQFDQIRALSSRNRAERAGAPKLGNVVVLHGIMGGELTLFEANSEQSIWVNAMRLVQGRFDRL